MIGVNSRLDSVQAAVLKVKLQYLDDYAQERNRAANYYNNAFKDHPKLKVPAKYEKSTHVFHQYTLITKDIDRDGLLQHLNSKEIPAAVYYPVPLHLQEAYLSPRYKEGDLPITEEAAKRVVSLPMSTELDEEQLEYITSAVLEYADL